MYLDVFRYFRTLRHRRLVCRAALRPAGRGGRNRHDRQNRDLHRHSPRSPISVAFALPEPVLTKHGTIITCVAPLLPVIGEGGVLSFLRHTPGRIFLGENPVSYLYNVRRYLEVLEKNVEG